MAIVISHQTAFTYWRSFTGTLATMKPVAPSTQYSLRLDKATLSELKLLELLDAEPLDVLAYGARKHASKHLNPHFASWSIPAGHIYMLSPHVFITDPLLTIALISRKTPLSQLALAICDLCGKAAILEDSLPERRPLTTTDELRAFLKSIPNPKALSKAILAADYAVNNSASPMESITALLLTLPHRLGGYAFPKPVLNQEMELPVNAQYLYPRRLFRTDLYWPQAHFDLEYNGAAFHTGGKSAMRDIARIAAIRSMGIDVLEVTAAQLRDPRAFESLSYTIAVRIGRRCRFRNNAWRRKHAQLRWELGLALPVARAA